MLSFARVRAFAVVAMLMLGAMVSIYLAISRDGSAATAEQGCPPGGVRANLDLPRVQDVTINVYNGTDQAGLAGRVGEDFANRDFQVLERLDDPEGATVEDVAVLRYGPEAVGAAQVLQAYFLNNAVGEFDIARSGPVVDVVIGTRFRQLATPTEVNQSIAQLGRPQPPPGTCAE